jgi:polyisoprenoid-binding protein YceI
MKILALSFAILFYSLTSLAGGEATADVSLTPAGSFTAKCDTVKGEAVLKGNTVTADKIVVDLRNLKTGISLRDKHSRDKYLEVDKYPEAILTDGKGKDGKGTGKLKIRGIEKAVSGSYTIKGDTLFAEFPIKLSDYDIKKIKYMGVGVDDEVTIKINVPVKKK